MKRLSRPMALLLAVLMVICSCMTALADQETYTLGDYDMDAFTAGRAAALANSNGTQYDVVNDLNAKATVTVDMGSDNQVTDGDTFDIKVEWTVPAEHTDASATYVYSLPTQFDMQMYSQSGTVYEPGTSEAMYYWSLNQENKITITFTQSFLDGYRKSAYFDFPGKINVGPDVTPGEDIVIKVPGGEDITVIIPEQEVPAEKQKPYMQKYVERVYLNDEQQYVVDYKIKVVPENDCTNVVVKDYIGSSSAYYSYVNNMQLVEDSVTAWVDSHYSGDDVGAVDDKKYVAYKIEQNSYGELGVIVWELGDIKQGGSLTGEGAAEITYSVILDWDGKTTDTYYNTATAESDNSEFYSYTENVTLTPPTVQKNGSAINAQGSITWTITVNFNNSLSATIIEEPRTEYEELFEQNKSASVTVTYSDNRTETHTLNDLINGLQLNATTMGQTATIVFDMSVPDAFRAEHYKVRNDVRIQPSDSSDYAEVTVSEHPMKSKTGTVDILGEMVTWTVELDFKQKPSSTKPYYDYVHTYGTANVFMVDGSFMITCPLCGSDKKVKEGSAPSGESEYCAHAYYDAVENPMNGYLSGDHYLNGYKLFELYFTESASSGEYELQYVTRYEPDSSTSYYGTSVEFRNRIIDAVDYSKYVEDTKIFDTDFISKFSDDGLLKYTEWSPEEVGQKDNKVSWYISFTHNIGFSENVAFMTEWEEGQKAVCVYDELPENFEVNAVYWVKANGETADITNQCTKYSDSDNLYRIEVPYSVDGIKAGYPMDPYAPGDFIRIDTTYNGEVGVQGQSFSNSAWFSIDVRDEFGNMIPDYGPQNTAMTTIRPEPKISKAYQYDNGTVPFIKYTVTVNPSAENLVENENDSLYVEDTMCETLVFQPGTLKVNGSSWDEYKWNPDTHVLTVNGLLDETKYVITYDAFVSAAYNTWVTLTNSAVLRGSDGNPPAAETSYTGTVFSGYGGGASSGSVGIQVLKMDNANQFLAGAQFVIKDLAGDQTIENLTVNEFGASNVWSIPADKIGKIFQLVETKAPDGYVKSDAIIYFGIPNSDGNFSETVPAGVEVVSISSNMLRHQFTIVNEPAIQNGTLSISKTVTASAGVTAPVKDFTFAVELKDSDEVLDTITTYKVGDEVKHITDGKITLKAGETAIIDGIPAGSNYTVTETDIPVGFAIAETDKSKTGTIEAGQTSTAAFTNIYTVADLTITKIVVGTDAPETDEFTFTVELKEGETALTGFQYKIGAEGPLEAISADGIKLKKGESATITGIPVGATYTITETAHADYTTKVGEVAANVATGTIAAENNAVTFTNTYKYGSLKITKSFNGCTPAHGETFVFDVKDASGKVVTQVVLTGEEAVTVHKLEVGNTYTVSENNAWTWRYTADQASKSATISASEQADVSFTNTRSNSQWLDDSAYADNNFDGSLPKVEID